METRIIFRVVCISLLLALLGGCSTILNRRSTGTLPNKWWQIEEVGQIENFYRERATGIEKAVKLFIAEDDSNMNIDRSTAVDNARLDAAVQLSRYLSQKVTSVEQSSIHINLLNEAVSAGNMTQEASDKIKKKIEETFSGYRASVTSTQFSSFKEIGQHTEKDGAKYIAWVCYSMSDQILEETRELQRKAFESLVTETTEYRKTMQEIQELIAKTMKEIIEQDMKKIITEEEG